jgi:hypothetical protein
MVITALVFLYTNGSLGLDRLSSFLQSITRFGQQNMKGEEMLKNEEDKINGKGSYNILYYLVWFILFTFVLLQFGK